jgi:hypothetical protein
MIQQKVPDMRHGSHAIEQEPPPPSSAPARWRVAPPGWTINEKRNLPPGPPLGFRS